MNKAKSQTNIFFNLEKRNFNRKIIKSLKRPDGALICDEVDILKEIELYYRDLYSSVIDRRHDFLKSSLETSKYQNSKIQLEMNWKEKSRLRNVKTFYALFLNRKNPQEMMDLRGNSTIASLICWGVTL